MMSDSMFLFGGCTGSIFMGVFLFLIIMVGISLFKLLPTNQSK